MATDPGKGSSLGGGSIALISPLRVPDSQRTTCDPLSRHVVRQPDPGGFEPTVVIFVITISA